MNTPVAAPYRSIVLGESCSVTGWNGDRVVTSKGAFYLKRLCGKAVETSAPDKIPLRRPFNSLRLLEIATVSKTIAGDLLLNSELLLHWKHLPSRDRFNIRTNAGSTWYGLSDRIEGVAWFEVPGTRLNEDQIDLALADWQRVRSKKELSSLNWLFFDPPNFAAWSRPVWLTELRSEPYVQSGTAVLAMKQLGRLAFTPDFTFVRLGQDSIDLSSRAKARYCIQFLVTNHATSEASARSLIDEIDPYVRKNAGLPRPASIKIDDYFTNDRTKKLKLLRQAIRCSGGGRYFLSI